MRLGWCWEDELAQKQLRAEVEDYEEFLTEKLVVSPVLVSGQLSKQRVLSIKRLLFDRAQAVGIASRVGKICWLGRIVER